MPPTPATGAAGLLARQLKGMQQARDLPGISCGLVNDNVFEWEVMLMISDDCKYYGGTYPSLPPPPLHCEHELTSSS
jgi:ubiquitin-conjugating enzyme E2 G1